VATTSRNSSRLRFPPPRWLMRRAAGTITPIVVLRTMAGRRRATSADDIEALSNGETLLVAALRRDGSRMNRGQLMRSSTAVVWRPYSYFRHGPGVALPPPHRVAGVGMVNSRAVKSDLFRMMSLETGGVSVELAVPIIDVALVRAALGG